MRARSTPEGTGSLRDLHPQILRRGAQAGIQFADPHTRAKAAPLDLGALLAVRDGLSAGASGLRTRGPIRASFITDARRQFQGTALYHETTRQ